MNYIKPLYFGTLEIKNNLILAPLAGYSHKPMRIMNRKFGAGYTVTEMVSVEGILRDSKKTLRYADISDDPQGTSIQIFGKDSPQDFYKASKILQNLFNVQSININFGCPAPKVLKNGAGSRLLEHPERIADIVNAVKDSGVNVEAKIRYGFSYDNLDNIIHSLDESDVDVIMLHCRLTNDKFKHGTAKWDCFKRARALTSKTLIANGDIKTPEDALEIFSKYQVDGLMIGRGAIAKPYIFKQIIDYCSTGSYTELTPQELLLLLQEYAELWFKITGFETIIPLRGALMSLLHGFEGVAKIRSELAHSTTIDDIYRSISLYQE